MDKLSTILVEPKCEAFISKSADIGEFFFFFRFINYIFLIYFFRNPSKL